MTHKGPFGSYNYIISWGPPGSPSRAPWGSPEPTLRTTASGEFVQFHDEPPFPVPASSFRHSSALNEGRPDRGKKSINNKVGKSGKINIYGLEEIISPMHSILGTDGFVTNIICIHVWFPLHFLHCRGGDKPQRLASRGSVPRVRSSTQKKVTKYIYTQVLRLSTILSYLYFTWVFPISNLYSATPQSQNVYFYFNTIIWKL